MEPEEIKPSGGKKFLKIIFSVFVVIVVLLGTAFVLTAMKNAKQIAEVSVVVPVIKEYTQEEKLQMLHDFAYSLPVGSATTTDEKLRLLHNFVKKTPQDSPAEQARKLELLHAFAPSMKQ